MAVPFLDLKAQYLALKPEIDGAMEKVIGSTAFILGPAVESFEKDFTAYCGVKHCIGVNSGTAALALLMKAHGIGAGDEVITVTNSFFATAEAISLIGATPVLIDCDAETALMDATKIEAAITPKTKAIIPVHLYGQIADMDAVTSVAQKHHLLVFEDACQAHGAMHGMSRAGSLADGAAFSFYPGKNLGAYGEGGGVVTNDDEIASKVRALRDHGMRQKYVHEFVGWNERLDGLQGAVLGVKLPHLDAWNERRRTLAAMYREKLAGTGDIRFIAELPDSKSAYHLFVIRTAERDALQKHLADEGIQTVIHYPIPIHLQKAYADRGWKRGDFPAAEKLADEILSLPISAELKDEQLNEVVDAVKKFFA